MFISKSIIAYLITASSILSSGDRAEIVVKNYSGHNRCYNVHSNSAYLCISDAKFCISDGGSFKFSVTSNNNDSNRIIIESATVSIISEGDVKRFNFKLLHSYTNSKGYVSDGSIYMENIYTYQHVLNKDISECREEIIDSIFNGEIPKSGVDIVNQGFAGNSDYNSSSLQGFFRQDAFQVKMDSGQFTDFVYLAIPQNPNGKLVWVNWGHGSGYSNYGTSNVIEKFLSNGYHVASKWMLLNGVNNSTNPKIDSLGVNGHNQLRLIEDELNTLSLYFEPIIRATNYIVRNYDVDSTNISYIGISGGGWTGAWIGALDDRFINVICVAGNQPYFVEDKVSNGSPDSGDYEQGFRSYINHYPYNFYRNNYSYIDLYIMSTSSKRRFYMIHNISDPCCFSGLFNKLYDNKIMSLAGIKTGGLFKTFNYYNTTHSYDNSIDLIYYLINYNKL